MTATVDPTAPSAEPAAGEERVVLGKVASPPRREATSEAFHFWVSRKQLVEKTQIVRTDSVVAGREVSFYAVVDEVFRQSRKRDIGEEFDAFDGDTAYVPEFAAEGITFATASILRAVPSVLTPPLEWSEVVLGAEQDAFLAYGADEIDHKLAVGLVKNGGEALAGPGYIDLDYLLGANGGHMNVNGSAGRGTKSSFLLFSVAQLLREARRQAVEAPSADDRLQVVPIVFNVKGFDLFHIHHANRNFEPEKHLADWQALGVDTPGPFAGVRYYAPQMKGAATAIPTGCDMPVQPYSWGLKDIVMLGLLPYLFADEDANDANFGALVLDIEEWLTDERRHNDGSSSRALRTDQSQPTTLQELVNWVKTESRAKEDHRTLHGHHSGTWGKLYRRLVKLVIEGDGVLRRHDQAGHPLNLADRQTTDPIVVDLNGLAGWPALQRFVVATVIRRLVDERTGTNAARGLVYLLVLDELNRFAPRGSGDPITGLIETVAAEMRSQGIILFGAQQQASKVSEKVVENAGIRVVGRSGTLELEQPVWRGMSAGARRKAAQLPTNEKLVIQDNFREPMHVRVPFPSWAMRRDEAAYASVPPPNGRRDEEIDTF
jgi:hypothetical protein